MTPHTIVISAGSGPIEVRQFVALPSEHLCSLCEELAIRVTSTSIYGDSSAPRSIEVVVTSDPSLALDGKVGTHVLISPSSSRSRRSRKRWFAGVSLHPTPKQVPVDIPPADVEIRTSRSGGPGGQHVNTTDSAVRILHRPSGIRVRVTSERSQHQNRRLALNRLAAILAERQDKLTRGHKSEHRMNHYRFERGSAVASWTLNSKTGKLVAL
ncbi:MAG: peptide chain release factor-like protein [Kofleriaceae bacterium]|nr:peptide chain release factor-like protein [Kofleriaceae bacterium]